MEPGGAPAPEASARLGAGAVVAPQSALEHTDQRVLDTLKLRVFPGAARSELYEDAGDDYDDQSGQYRRTVLVTGHVVRVTEPAPFAHVELVH